MISWEQTEAIIESKQLGNLRRSQEQHDTYVAAKKRFEETHGGTANFVISERLGWTGEKLQAKSPVFMGDSEDLKVLINDFSYNFAPNMHHLVVWSKVRIPCGQDELPTAESTEKIEEFLSSYFTERFGVPRNDMLWFKNTVVLQSIPSVSHFHVLIRDRTPEEIRAMCQPNACDV